MQNEEIMPIDTFTVINRTILHNSDRKNLSAPFSRNNIDLDEFLTEIKGKHLIAGNIGTNIKEKLDENNIQVTDILKREEFIVLTVVNIITDKSG